jgi:hypothetical protein
VSGPGDKPLRVRCFEDPGHCFDIVFLAEEWRDGKRYVGEMVFHEDTERDNGSRREWKPSFALDPAAAQELASRLWDAGMRPRGAAGSAGQLDAVQAHLADMRRLAEKLGQVLEMRLAAGEGRARDLDRLTAEVALAHGERRDLAEECQIAQTAERRLKATVDALRGSVAETERTLNAEVERLKGVLAAARQKVLALEAPHDVANFLQTSLEPGE